MGDHQPHRTKNRKNMEAKPICLKETFWVIANRQVLSGEWKNEGVEDAESVESTEEDDVIGTGRGDYADKTFLSCRSQLNAVFYAVKFCVITPYNL